MPVDVQDPKTAYNAWHDRLAVDMDADSPWHRMVRRHLEPIRDVVGKRVLEIGCGRGGFACWLASQSLRPAGIIAADFSARAVEKGRAFALQHGLSGVTWEISDIQAIPHPEASFDTVISCETIEHVRDPRKALRELARVLKPGGRLLLTAPNYLGTFGLYRFYLRLRGRTYTEEDQPINNFLLLPLTMGWVRRSGLRVRTVDGVGHYLPCPGRRPIEMSIFDRPRIVMRWLALHSLIVAQKR